MTGVVIRGGAFGHRHAGERHARTRDTQGHHRVQARSCKPGNAKDSQPPVQVAEQGGLPFPHADRMPKAQGSADPDSRPPAPSAVTGDIPAALSQLVVLCSGGRRSKPNSQGGRLGSPCA